MAPHGNIRHAMIVRPKPRLMDIALAWRGSILPRLVGRLAAITIISAAAVLFAQWRPGTFSQISAIPFTLIGLALSIFMSFRNNACYDRWWEGRKLWGQLIIASRSFARQTAALDLAERKPLLHGLCGFAGGLAARLRGEEEAAAIGRWSQVRDWTALPNPTDAVLRDIGFQCLTLAREGRISDIHYSVLETTLTELCHVQGGCERIAATPLPFAYSLLLHRTAHIFCLALPFALAGTLGWWTPLPVLLVSYTFFGLDALGDELEDPFGADPNDLPLDTMTRIVERDLLAALGERELPPPILPDKHFLP